MVRAWNSWVASLPSWAGARSRSRRSSSSATGARSPRTISVVDEPGHVSFIPLIAPVFGLVGGLLALESPARWWTLLAFTVLDPGTVVLLALLPALNRRH